MPFYAVYDTFLFLILLMKVCLCFLTYAVLAQLKEKGKTHYRAWVLPSAIGNTISAAYTLFILSRRLLHTRLTVQIYYFEFVFDTLVGLIAVYALWCLYQSVNHSPIKGETLPAQAQSPEGVWPPSPRMPGSR